MKKFNTIFFTLLITLLSSITAFAQPTTIYDDGSNFDPDHAQVMQSNAVTPSSTVNASYSGQFVADGNISDEYDYNWYKIYLNANPETVLSINSKDLSYSGKWEIFSGEAFKVPILSITHIQDYSHLGATPYYVNIPTSGYYYVRVSSPVATGNYRFTLGGCNYAVDNYSYTASSPITITPSLTEDYDSYDLRNAPVPNDAIVYDATINGSTRGNVSSQSRYIKTSSDSYWSSTSSYSYSKSFSVYLNKHLKDVWQVKLKGTVPKRSTSYSLTPRIRFSYVYAVLPQR